MCVSKQDLKKNTNELIRNFRVNENIKTMRLKGRETENRERKGERTDMVENVLHSMENKLQGFENIWNTFLECL